MKRPAATLLLPLLTLVLALASVSCVTAAPPRSRTPARPATGVEHMVQRGESLWKISRAYGVSIEMIALANELGSDSRIDVGQKLFIPGATKVRSTAAPRTSQPAPAPKSVPSTAQAAPKNGARAQPKQAAASPSSAPPKPSSPKGTAPALQSKADDEGRASAFSDGGPKPAAAPFLPVDDSASRQYAPQPPSRDKPLAWPVRGVLYARFGKRAESVHDGIDIAAPEATPIRAAAAGTVLFSAPQPGYGNLIILQHEGGLLTLYAHNRENLVKEGDRVRLGQVIARMGIGSPTSGPYLHFEVRVGGVPKNPLDYLPPPR